MIKDGYAICYNEWTLDERIKNELRLLLMISCLSAEQGYCWASNSYFAKLLNESEVQISRKIKKLEQYGYIVTTYKKRDGAITTREIRLSKMITAVIKNDNRTLIKNDKHKNININNINNNNKWHYEDENIIDFESYYANM